MPKLPRVTAREAERAIMRDGWLRISGSGGSYRQYTHPTKAGRVTIAHHAGRVLDPRTLTSILRQSGLTADQFRALL
jgi:predicted RNA binding protein YcfA (HicA-like mRNA interferase family)